MRNTLQAASVQHTAVLLGDYNLKLARQEYLTSKQDVLIDHLLQQRARKELIKLLLRQDQAEHTGVHALLEATKQHLATLADQFQARCKAMRDAKAQHSAPKRMVHSADSSILRLHKVLQPARHKHGAGRAVLVEHSAVGGELAALRDRLDAARQRHARALRQHAEQTGVLETRLQTYEALVYGGAGRSAATGHEPELTHPTLKAKLSALQTNIDTLGGMVKRLSDQIAAHEHTLGASPAARCEAQLMEYFYTDPSRLPTFVEDAISQAQARA